MRCENFDFLRVKKNEPKQTHTHTHRNHILKSYMLSVKRQVFSQFSN